MRAVISSLAFLVVLMALVSGQTPATNRDQTQASNPSQTPATNPPQVSPVGPDASSIAAGRGIYESSCASCHGDYGKGDGRLGEELSPKPTDLTSSTWSHGSTDREVFSEVRNGIKGTGMKAFGHKLTTHQIWDLVNYLHTLRPARGRSRPSGSIN
ncbi:MAG TPA: c-type cytochrome [Vicinamibacterales bacterium]|jgi:mono/diheme cytochrome c family protein|nr:c-type cytochrome [Vicinamibacterales bacterium]